MKALAFETSNEFLYKCTDCDKLYVTMTDLYTVLDEDLEERPKSTKVTRAPVCWECSVGEW